jgi:hypothetical protein
MPVPTDGDIELTMHAAKEFMSQVEAHLGTEA